MEFPTVYKVIEDGYSIRSTDGAEQSRADDGTLRIRRLWGQDRTLITFRVGLLTQSEYAALIQFYRSYRFQAIGWTDPLSGIAYSVLMTEEPRQVQVYATGLLVAEVSMEGVAT